MAAPTYAHDLTDWIADNDTTAWGELTGKIAGGNPDEADTESALQGTNTVSQATASTSECTMGRVLGSPTTLTTGQVFLVWHGHGVATALDSYANGGLRLYVLGNGLGNYKGWAVGGNDVPPFPYGKWVNNPVDPTVTDDGAGYTAGTPPTGGTNIYGVGSGVVLTQAVAKGQPHVVDMIRYGRAEARFTDGDATTPATFAGFAAVNDTQTNRLGLISATTGGFLWKGLMNIGYNGTPCYFKDLNKNIFIQDTRKVTSSFNKIEIRTAGTVVDWTNMTFQNASPSTTASKGDFEVVDDVSVTLADCQFIDMGTFILKSNTTASGAIFRRCGTITQNGATITGCRINSSTGTAAVIANDVAAITDSTFISSGTGYAIEGFSTAGDYSVDTNIFSGYGANDTANAALHILATTGTVNIAAPANTTYTSDGATVNLLTAQATLTITGVQPGSDVVVLAAGTETKLQDTQDLGGTSVGYIYTYTPSTFVDVLVYCEGYVPYAVRNYELPATSQSLPVKQVFDRNYVA